MLFCKSRLNTLGQFDFVTETITIYFPTDTGDNYTDATVLHEVTHAELATSTTAGVLDSVLAKAAQSPELPDSHKSLFRHTLLTRLTSSQYTHEGLATYLGLRKIATADVHAPERIYKRLPPEYKLALDQILEVMPDLNPSGDQFGRDLLFLMALGRCSLNYPIPPVLLNSRHVGSRDLAESLCEPNADKRLMAILSGLTRQRKLASMLGMIDDMVNDECGVHNVTDIPDDKLNAVLGHIAVHLDREIYTLVPSLGTYIEREERVSMVNDLLERSDRGMYLEIGVEPFPRFIAGERRAVIRTLPGEGENPTRASSWGKYKPVTEQIAQQRLQLLGSIRVAGVSPFLLHATLKANPSESELRVDDGISIGPTDMLVGLAVWVGLPPDSCAWEEWQADCEQMIRSAPHLMEYFCVMTSTLQTSAVIRAASALSVIWHIDLEQYLFRLERGEDVRMLNGLKLVDCDDTDHKAFVRIACSLAQTEDVYIHTYRLKPEFFAIVAFQRSSATYWSKATPAFDVHRILGDLSSNPRVVHLVKSKPPDDAVLGIGLLFHYGL